jgi:hypothetical protein
MEMSGEYRIPVPREQVWEALNDPEILKASIPGCSQLDKLSDTEMSATVDTKIGMVRARFIGAVILTNINPPVSYTITGEGKGGVAGFAKGGADVELAEENGGTVLRYTAKGHVGGKIAQVGARLIDATAKQMADQFFAAFAEKVSGASTETDGVPILEEPAAPIPMPAPAPAPMPEEPAAAAPATPDAPQTSTMADRLAAAANAPFEDHDDDEGVVARAEHAVEDAAHAVAEVAREAEAETEAAAARGFLGGPQIWALIAIIVGIALVVWFQ